MRLILAAALLALLQDPAQARRFEVLSVDGGRLTTEHGLIKPGDVLKRGRRVFLSAGQAVLDLGREGRILLKGPASFTPARSGGFLHSGGILNVLGKLKRRFKLRTSAIVASVRGTSFYLEAREGQTYLCRCEGRLKVRGNSKPARHVRLDIPDGPGHKAYLFTHHPERVRYEQAPLEKHTDEEIEEHRKEL